MPNPLLNEKTFEQSRGGVALAERPPDAPTAASFGVTAPPWADPNVRTMTIGGTCSAAAVMLVVLAAGATVGWGRVTESFLGVTADGTKVYQGNLSNPGWLIAALIVGFGLAILTMFKPPVARYTALPYALCEGLVLGMISHLYDVQSKGVAIQAVLATLGVFGVMLLLYGLRILRATPRFVKGVVGAMAGIFAIYLVGLISSAFGHDIGIFSSTSALSIGFSLIVVVVASLRLILSFDLIERGANEGAPRYMEWYGAFGLIVALVWLYLEILSLLSKMQRR